MLSSAMSLTSPNLAQKPAKSQAKLISDRRGTAIGELRIMGHDKQNAIRDMVDFDVRLRANEASEGHFYVEAELRAAEAEIYDDTTGITLKVSAQRIMLRFEMEGLEVAPGARHHDELRTTGPTRKTTDKAEFRASGAASTSVTGRAGVDGMTGNAEATVKGEAAVNASRTVEATSESATRYVIARPGDRWEVVEDEGQSLDATYLTSETPLCVVRTQKGANRAGLTATAEILERDLKIDLVMAKSLLGKVSVTKKKLTEIVIAKALAESIGAKYKGKIIVSRVETDVES